MALLTLMALAAPRSCGVEITRFSGHAVTLRSAPPVVADTPTSRSVSTCIASGRPPSATWSAAMFFGLYRMGLPPCFGRPTAAPLDFIAPATRRRVVPVDHAEKDRRTV